MIFMKKTKKLFNIFLRYLKMDMMYDLSSRTSFMIMVGVEVFYVVASMIFFNVLYGNIKTLVGWSYYEMLLLVGFDTVMTELLIGFIFANGTNALPKRITTGYVDYFLLKPVPSYFLLNFVQPYFPSLVSTGFGFLLMGIALTHLSIPLSVLTIVGTLILAGCGFAIGASIMIIVASLAFKFSDAKTLPRIGMNTVIFFSDKPHHMFNNVILKSIFFLIIPAVFLSSIPMYSLTHGVVPSYLISALILAFVFIHMSKKIWDRMIINYTSASS